MWLPDQQKVGFKFQNKWEVKKINATIWNKHIDLTFDSCTILNIYFFFKLYINCHFTNVHCLVSVFCNFILFYLNNLVNRGFFSLSKLILWGKSANSHTHTHTHTHKHTLTHSVRLCRRMRERDDCMMCISYSQLLCMLIQQTQYVTLDRMSEWERESRNGSLKFSFVFVMKPSRSK